MRDVFCNIAFYKRINIFLLSVLGVSFVSFINTSLTQAQVFVPLEREAIIQTEQSIFGNEIVYSTFLKPYDYSTFENIYSTKDTFLSHRQRPWWVRKMFYESYLVVDSPNYKLIANPLFHFSYGKMSDNSLPYYHNIRGVLVGGNLLGKLYFESSVLECQSRFPIYLSDYIHSANVAPGMGQARRFGTGAFDYAIAQGNIAFSIHKRLKLYLGTGKFFAGDGYRSLLLSDVSFNYPYISLQYHSGRWYFTRIFSVTMIDTLPISAYGVRGKRLNSFGVISFLPHRRVELSFFEGYVFRYPNRIQNTRLNPLFFNPLPFADLIKRDSGFSSVIGFNIRLNVLPRLILYQQIALGNPHYRQINKANAAYQLGIKWYNAFSVPNLYLQSEWNIAGEQVYTSSDSALYYSHFNQPLAHLLGNNFDEKILFAVYSFRRATFTAQSVWSKYGYKAMPLLPKKSRFVSVLSYPTPFLGTGPYTETNFIALSLGYWINPQARQKIEIGYIVRKGNINPLVLESQLFYIAFKVNWNNVYIDF